LAYKQSLFENRAGIGLKYAILAQLGLQIIDMLYMILQAPCIVCFTNGRLNRIKTISIIKDIYSYNNSFELMCHYPTFAVLFNVRPWRTTNAR
jgi:hypothetical protein